MCIQIVVTQLPAGFCQKANLNYVQYSFRCCCVFQFEILGSSLTRDAKEYDCCPGEIYPSLEVSIQFKQNSYFSKANELVTP